MLTIDQINIILLDMTDKPWFSWPAHYDERRRSVYWGSDFVTQLDRGSTAQDVRESIQHYIDNRMREKSL